MKSKHILAAAAISLAAAITPAAAQTAPAPTDPGAAFADLVAVVDLSEQTMSVFLEGELLYVWAVSTGAGDFTTPTGQWTAQWLSANHRSSRYNNAPMPWSVFFYGGYAVHGTTETDRLGSPASHGCVRLLTENAAVFFALVEATGLSSSLISIVA